MVETLRAWDARMMQLALRLARRGLGFVEPNPAVGAVICRRGRIVGRGWHRAFGGPHAEVEAIREAAGQARGGTLYVTLEPCCHTGKTGPCTEAILAAGIKRVVAAMPDPNPLVGGQGLRRLRRAGVEVTTGIGQRQAERLTAPFRKWITTRRPYVTLKWAQSIDGCVADRNGRSKWISSPPARQLVHQLRGRVDAIMVGIGTVLADDPMLTARPAHSGDRRRVPQRLILDSACRLPLQSHLAQTARNIPVAVFHNAHLSPAAHRRRRWLEELGVQCRAIPAMGRHRLDLRRILQVLGAEGCSQVLVEGGPQVLGDFLARHLADQAWVFVAPRILGDDLARHAVAGIPVANLNQCAGATVQSVRRCGPDLWLRLNLV